MTATDHASGSAIEIFPVTGPGIRSWFRYRRRDHGRGERSRRTGARDADVVVVTSKIFSKTEGRMVAAPTAPEERDRLRRKLISDETVRILARRNATWITENRNGLVQAAAGVDGSNVARDQLALLPLIPMPAPPDSVSGSPNWPAAPWASSSPTPWAGPGGPGRPTWPSARPVSRCPTATTAQSTAWQSADRHRHRRRRRDRRGRRPGQGQTRWRACGHRPRATRRR